MAYEALIVIGFGVALAVVSVALFVAHVKRINAPNRADPTGTLVHIDLGAALAKDEATRNRKLSSRGSSSTGASGQLSGGAIPGVFALQQNGVGRRRRRSSSCATNGSGEGVAEEVVKREASTTAKDPQVWSAVAPQALR